MNDLDAFICHAVDDKEAVVNLLALLLREKGIRVRYEAWALEPGDNLEKRIDDGLARSRFGIVVLSPSFFDKGWTQAQLDLLPDRKRDGKSVILPIRHRLGHAEVAAHSVPLANHAAWTTSNGVPMLVKQLVEVLGQSQSAA